MTDRDRQRIGGVVGFRNAGKREQRFHHLLDLKLFGVAMADYSLFHESG